METIKYKNIPIFQYGGMNSNNVFISKEVILDAVNTFVDVPIFEHSESDLYNENQDAVGTIESVNKISNNFVYGDIVVFNDKRPIEFKNYGINVKKSHKDGDMLIIDKFQLMSISLEFDGR